MTTPSSTNRPRILVFDSGVGGLSIFQEIRKKLPAASIIYASDNAFFPYGTKGEAELITRVVSVLDAITIQHSVDIIVIACNTASTLTLPHLRAHFSQPVVGVVPAIKPAAKLSKSQVIGLLATPATIARPYTHALIAEHAASTEVISVGSSELVQIAEKKLRGQVIQPQEIASIIAPFKAHPRADEIDTIVLACTHFPLVREELALHFSNNVQFIDSGEAIARRVASLLNHTSVEGSSPIHSAIFTLSSPAVESLMPELVKNNIDSVDILIV